MNRHRFIVRAATIFFTAATAVFLTWGCGTTTGSYGVLRVLGSRSEVVRAHRAGAVFSVNVIDRNGTAVGSLLIEDARLVLKDIQLRFGTEAATEEETEQNQLVEYVGPYLVDLLANTSVPTLGSVPLVTGIYRQIEMKLRKIDGTEIDASGNPLVAASDPMFGNSIYLSGKYTGPYAGGTATAMPLIMSYDFDETFELSPPEGSTKGMPIAKGVSPILIAFRFAEWVNFANPLTNDKNVDLTLAVDSSGTIRLDNAASGVNADIRTVIKNIIESSADYGVDVNDDGELSVEEDDD